MNLRIRKDLFFPDDVTRFYWVTIQFTDDNSKEGKVCRSCTMFPLKLCCSLTPWNVQGSMVHRKLLADLGITETSVGLPYVLFSRLHIFKDIYI